MLRTALIIMTVITVGFAPLIEGGTTHLPVFILHLLVLSMLAAWLIDGYKNGRLTLHVCAIDLAAMAFFAVSLISIFIAPYKYMALVWVQILLYYLLFIFLSREALYGAPGASRSTPVAVAVLTVLGMGAVESVWGLGQWVYGSGRPTGSFFNPDMLAGYLAPSCLLAVSMSIFLPLPSPPAGEGGPKGRVGVTARRGRRALLLLLAALCLAVVVLTGSRGGVLALGAGALVVLLSRFGKLGLAIVAAALLAVIFIPNPVRDRVLGSHDPFAYSRAGIWKSSLEMMRDHPQGVGLGNFKYAFTRYNFPVREAVIKYGKVAGTAHSEYLHVGAEMGFIGLVVFIIGVILLARTLKRSISVFDNPSSPTLPKGGEGGFGGGEDKGLAVGLAGGITAVFVHALVDSDLHEPGIVFLLILLVSLALRISGEASREFVLKGGKTPGKLILYIVFIALMAVFAAMPGAAYYFSSKAKSEVRAGDMKSGLADVDKALLIEPGNAAYHSQRAALSFTLYQRGGGREDLQDAIAGLEDAIRLNPGDVSYELIITGIEYGYAATLPASAERDKTLRAALGHADRAVELAPNTAEALMAQARIYAALGDTGSAVKVLDKLKASEPNYLRGRLSLAEKYWELGKTGLSKSEYYNIIETARALTGSRLSPEDAEFVKIDPARLDLLGKKLGVQKN